MSTCKCTLLWISRFYIILPASSHMQRIYVLVGWLWWRLCDDNHGNSADSSLEQILASWKFFLEEQMSRMLRLSVLASHHSYHLSAFSLPFWYLFSGFLWSVCMIMMTGKWQNLQQPGKGEDFFLNNICVFLQQPAAWRRLVHLTHQVKENLGQTGGENKSSQVRMSTEAQSTSIKIGAWPSLASVYTTYLSGVSQLNCHMWSEAGIALAG